MKMEKILSSPAFSFVYAILLLLVVLHIRRMLNRFWFRPQKIEKCLRKQGFNGNSYRIMFGDLKEMITTIKEARTSNINTSDDIVPRVIPFIHKTINTYGKNSFIWHGSRADVIIMEPELIREVFQRNFEFLQPKVSNPLIKVLATGLPNYDRDKWVKHRQLLSPAFHIRNFKNMVSAIYISCDEMISEWGSKFTKGMGSCELDVWPYLQVLSNDAISRSAFGGCYQEGRRIFQLQKQQAELVLKAAQSVYIPGWRFVPTKSNKRMQEIDKKIVDSIRAIIDKRMIEMKGGEATNDDLLGLLLESNLKKIQNHGNTNVGMTTNEVIDECKVFYFAGQETTSVLLVWTVILLSTHVNWQTRAREEVLRVFGNNKPNLEGLNHLKVVTMILYEVLRLYPPVFELTRTIEEDTKLGKISLPAGVKLILPTIILHRDNVIWGDDAKEFKPDRFSEGVSTATKGQVSFFPFGWGPRTCIGQNFAILQAKMTMAMILQRFSFNLSPSYTHAPHTVLTLQPQHGAHIILHKLYA